MTPPNTNPEYRFITPKPSISDFVYRFAEVRHLWKVKDLVLIPNAKTDLIFVKEKNGTFRVSWVGLETRPNLMTQNSHEKMFVISFHPLAVEYIFRASIASILDSQKTLPDDFWNFNIGDFNNFEAFCEKMSRQIHALAPQNIDSRKQNLFALILAANGEIPIKEISEKVFWSTRQINQYFNQQYGLSLKTYCKLLRFEASLTHIKNGKIFPELNYYDQSHFIKEIRKFTNASPKELFREQNSRFLQLLAFDSN